uniref:Pleiotrophin/Midkine C-terminal domain-containing protein n=1 Tax=Clastoptera arizonana TaxID=38151 RepID=A0A1B6CL98_9HEMI
MKWNGVLVGVLLLITVVFAEGEIWEEDEKEVLIRSERGTKANKEPCRYEKGSWSECDTKTNMRSRTLTLKDRKKSDASGTMATCELTKTIQKKCKKGARRNRQ